MRLPVTLLCILGLLAITGCEQRIPKDELGTVVFRVPAIGDDKPPPLPELDGIPDTQPPHRGMPR